ncbi:MAG: UvrABC system protein C [Alphaproteobacteria bacterium]|nr:MAG: UvrABC system protein C [Alphaproteobacteria bacterium]
MTDRTRPDTVNSPAAADIAWEEARAPGEAHSGVELIGAFVRRLPNSPGVYRMFNAAGDVLYVGKARSLKKRVAAYAKSGGHSNRIARMIGETAAMEFVRTHTETEALLLEANLIKRLRPRFNVLLRDDKSFPYIVITDDHAAPGIFKHRGARLKNRSYFGPFASAVAVARTINSLQKAFLIRTCTDSVYESRTRPCLLYQIKRCSAPCTGEIPLKAYGHLVGEAKRFLSGRSSQIRARLGERMQAAAEALDFETAAIYRDRLAALSHIQGHQGINPRGVEDADVFAVAQEGGQTCIQVFFFRTGQNWGNRAYFPRADRSYSAGEVLGAFLAQFYDDKPCPRLVLISHAVEESELLEEALALKAGHRVEVLAPRRGGKKDMVDHATMNAREALARRLAETSSQATLLQGVAAAFGLEAAPRRIEVYDNSHIMGTNPVGAMIVAGPDGFAKNQYRKFNIRSAELTPGDDYAMMREVMKRRFTRLVREAGPRGEAGADGESSGAGGDGLPPWPDLVLIDGGQGQLNAAREALAELGIADDLTLVGVAKGPDRDAGREKFFMAGRTSFILPERDPVLYFVQRLRDEAHRFAIGSHRARRRRELVRNPLDEIAGIGPSRKRALLMHFGTAKAVSRAALPDLVAVEGISEQTARAIYDHFHEKA